MVEPKIPDSSEIPAGPLSAEAFLAWRERQPEGVRYELHAGEIVVMQSERHGHHVAKSEIFGQFREQLRGAGKPCRAYGDGMAVRLEDGVVYEPDAMVRCGDPLGPDIVQIEDPLLVVEVASPSTSRIDSITKRVAYFAAPSLAHMVIIDLKSRAVIHEFRTPGAYPSRDVASRVHFGGVVTFDPPGLTLDVDALWAEVDAA